MRPLNDMRLPGNFDEALQLLNGRLALDRAPRYNLVVCGGTALNATDILDRLLDLLCRQWSTLGVPGRIGMEERRVVDQLLKPEGSPTPWVNWAPLFRALEMLWNGHKPNPIVSTESGNMVWGRSYSMKAETDLRGAHT